MKKVLIISLLALFAGCTQPDRAAEALKDAGYSDIHITGYAFFSCSEKDTFATAFEAKGVTGRRVSGAVCSGFLKGQTIRLD